MKHSKKINTTRLTILIVITSIFLALLISTFVMFYLDVFDDNALVFIVYLALYVLFAGLLGISVTNFISGQHKIRNLRIENKYRFGIDSTFYDYTLFERRVAWLRLVNKQKQKGYVIAFTTMPSTDASAVNPNEKALNAAISEYLIHRFYTKGNKGRDAIAFCFFRSNFLLYSFFDLEKTHDIISSIQETIFRIIKEKELTIMAQPYFGVAEIANDLELVRAVDRAIIARNHAAKSFETITFYKDQFYQEIRNDEMKELQRALQNNEFVVYYQPKFSLKTKSFVGAEALVRWDSPVHGFVPPSKFIKKAEIGGLIHDIDFFVMKQVMKDLEEMRMQGSRVLPVSVNFSLFEFFSPTFLKDLQNLIDDKKLDPNLVEIEITETTSHANAFLAISILKNLKKMGFRILMDDFGSGFSNLNQLSKLPVDVVKIDKSYVDAIASNKKNFEIIKFLINLCKINNMHVVAEGVDSKLTLTYLESAKCDDIQGFYFSEPIPLKEYIAFLKDNKFEKKGSKKQ